MENYASGWKRLGADDTVKKVITIEASAYQQLMRAIVSGKIPPGQKITIEKVATELKVSTTPVREAIRQLEANGFLTIKRRKTIIRELSLKNIRQILELRLLLEGYAADKATMRRNSETMDKLERLVEQMDKLDDVESYLRVNKEFHDTIYRECELPVLQELIDSVWVRYSPYLHILLESKHGFLTTDLNQNHKGIAEGLQQKDPGKVPKYLEKDLVGSANKILEMLKMSENKAK